MSRHEFERDLTHLERIIPLLTPEHPLSIDYWRHRVTSLKTLQDLVPGGTGRVRRLLAIFNELERTTSRNE